MGDTGKRELVRFAEDLSRQAASADAVGATVTPFRPEPAHWENDRLYFQLRRNRRISCSVSHQVLEQVGPGRGARRWQLVETFERLRPHIERIAWNRFAAAPESTDIIEIFAADFNTELDDDPAPAAPAVALQRRVGRC